MVRDLLSDGEVHPIDYANASPDVALTSLHYYFPWAMKALVRWSVFCIATRLADPIDQDTRRYFEIGDREDLTYEEKLAAYRRARGRLLRGRASTRSSAPRRCRPRRGRARVRGERRLRPPARPDGATTFPVHEHEHFVAHYRGLLEAWASDQRVQRASWCASSIQLTHGSASGSALEHASTSPAS